jgi:hypothetical protein
MGDRYARARFARKQQPWKVLDVMRVKRRSNRAQAERRLLGAGVTRRMRERGHDTRAEIGLRGELCSEADVGAERRAVLLSERRRKLAYARGRALSAHRRRRHRQRANR